MELALENWQIAAGVFIVLFLLTVWTTISTRRGMRPVGMAGSLEAQAGRGVIEGTIGCLGFWLGLVALLGGIYIALRQPSLPIPGVRVQLAPAPTPTPIFDGRIRLHKVVEVVAPMPVALYDDWVDGQFSGRSKGTVVNGQKAFVQYGAMDCGGALCWRVELLDSHEVGWLPERLPTGPRVLALTPE